MDMRICSKCKRILPITNFYKHSIRGYQAYCKDCKNKYITSRTFRNKLERVKSWAASTLRRHKLKGFIIKITLQELIDYAMMIDNCEYTNVKLDWFAKDKPNKNSPSLDRIDNEQDIRIDNIRIVCKLVNTMKQNLTLQEYVKHCKYIYEHLGGEYNES